MKDYDIIYKNTYNFLKWVEYWQGRNCKFRHSSWKNEATYPSYIHIEKNSETLTNLYGQKWINKGNEFFAKDEKGFYSFFDKPYRAKGDWKAIPKKDLDDLFE